MKTKQAHELIIGDRILYTPKHGVTATAYVLGIEVIPGRQDETWMELTLNNVGGYGDRKTLIHRSETIVIMED